MNFVANLPYTKVWIKKEYLYDLEKGFDEEPVEGVLVAVKSMPVSYTHLRAHET